MRQGSKCVLLAHSCCRLNTQALQLMQQMTDLAVRAGFQYVHFDSVSRVDVAVLPDCEWHIFITVLQLLACTANVDLVFLLDSSESIAPQNYDLAKGTAWLVCSLRALIILRIYCGHFGILFCGDRACQGWLGHLLWL